VTRVLAGLLAAALLSGCAATSATTVQPRDGRSGLQGTGTVAGRQVAVTGGLPELLVGDCDPMDGADDDVCFLTDTIDGRSFVLTVENPAVLAEGAVLDVVDPVCAPRSGCDDVTDGAVVSVKLGTDAPLRATGGTLRLSRVEPFANYVGRVNLTLPDGSFSGTFDVVPRPE
jgi:hypothetical protein